ncbi:glycosyltransferase [Serinibacter arcticus]|uniref:glycosyltransferase n=1 Tax=Serinibacter arcticus TaxID=1655435 RepID=UPI0013050DA2|nr:glycosyltransferase [Serinibacter arcticus]
MLIVGAVLVSAAALATLTTVWSGNVSRSVVAALTLSTLTAAVLLLGLRELRRRLTIVERRLQAIESQEASRLASGPNSTERGADVEVARGAVADLERRSAVSTALLDLRVCGTGGPLDEVPLLLDERMATIAVRALTEDAQLLDADEVAQRYGLVDHLPLGTRRTLARGLRARGYLVRSMRYFRSAAATGQERDVVQLDLRQAEIDVMCGAFSPVLTRRDVKAPISGRVLHVVGRAIPDTQSGYTLRTHSTARAQVSAGHEAHVFVQLGVVESEVSAQDDLDGVVYHRPAGDSVFASGHRTWLQSNAEALLKTALSVRPETIHAHSDFYNVLIAGAVSDATGIPVVYETRGFWEETWLSRTAVTHGWVDVDRTLTTYGIPEAYSWRRQREADARERSNATVTLARTMQSRIVAAGLDGSNVTIVPNAVDASRFEAAHFREDLAEELGIPRGAVVIGSVTSVVEYEGLDVLVEAFAVATRSSDVPLWLMIVGDGPVLDQLRTQVETHGLTNVSITGRVPHDRIVDYYGLIDIFVVPRRDIEVCRLVTPLKPFEALAAGCALLMSDLDALREIAEDCGSVRLFRPDDVSALAAELSNMANAPSERRLMAERGRAWVRRERSWESNASAYTRVYASLGSTGSGRRTGV